MTDENDNDSDPNSRCGYVAVIGRPNVGKSTLLNRILNQKLSIVTDKPQTTRNRILAVFNREEHQIIFLDTPGLHSPRASLGRYMIEAAESAISDADVCVWLIDMSAPKRPEGLTNHEREIGARLTDSQLPVLVLLNKVDTFKKKELLLPTIEAAARVPGVKEVIPISARSGDGVDLFLDKLVKILPEGPKLYPEDMLSEQAERFFVEELIREALMDMTRQEVPYHTAVVIDKFVEEKKQCTIHASIHVERKSQRAIMIGKRGAMIREIGTRARLEAETFLGTPVVLKLHVEVSPGWTSNNKKLEEMGYK